MTNAQIDTFKLLVMLIALRLPSVQKHWQEIAEQADKEAWPAAHFLAVLAEYETAERETRRIQRHLNESKRLGGKTLATYHFEAMPSLP
jgi:DNA replication protein DnaC